MGVLRCTAIESRPERGLFRILLDDGPAPIELLERVARVADVLLRENTLQGRFAVDAEGAVALELPEAERTFFHNGIVFAALDAVNDPVRNPTLTLLAKPPDD
ncbi:MAG TPA: hypothetical protein VGH97_13815 [Thermoanaerobaculia bacterium]